MLRINDFGAMKCEPGGATNVNVAAAMVYELLAKTGGVDILKDKIINNNNNNN